MNKHTTTLNPSLDGTPAPSVGDMLGAYRLDAVAGEGGMGRVFRATHTKLDKRVAVKVLRRRYSRRADAIARFFQEARAVNVIRHPNIVEITDFFEGPTGGDSYYIMEWLDGTTLAARLAQERVLPVDLVVEIGRQVASALAAVHKAGFVHRDLKPDNIFLCEREGVLSARVLDFGVAMLQGPTDGAVAGTPAYFSPEGAAGRALDGRSDIYSLGVMLYELLSGAPPFQASSLSEYVMKHMTARPRPLLEVALHPLSPALVAIVERCLEKDPERRFQTMDELEAALAALPSMVAGGARPYPVRRIALAAVLVFLGAAAMTRGMRAVLGGRSIGDNTPALMAPGPVPAHSAGQGFPSASAPASARSPAEAARTVGGEPRPGARSATVGVRIDSTPNGAEVYRSGVVLGVTPCLVRVPPGHQLLDVYRPGWRRISLSIDARDGAAFSARLPLAPTRPAVRPHHALPSAPRMLPAPPVRPAARPALSAPPQKAATPRPTPSAPRPPSQSSTINPFD